MGVTGARKTGDSRNPTISFMVRWGSDGVVGLETSLDANPNPQTPGSIRLITKDEMVFAGLGCRYIYVPYSIQSGMSVYVPYSI